MKKLNILLLIISAFVSISAVFGGLGLIFKNGLDIPIEYLNGSIFNSYFWPGIILIFVIGGGHFVSFVARIKKSKYSSFLSLACGISLLIWIFVELYIMKQPHFLQIINFIFGVIEISISFLLKDLYFKK